MLNLFIIIGFQNKRTTWKGANLRIYAARFVRFSASTTLVFTVLSHLLFPSILITFSFKPIYNKSVKVKGGFDYVIKT